MPLVRKGEPNRVFVRFDLEIVAQMTKLDLIDDFV